MFCPEDLEDFYLRYHPEGAADIQQDLQGEENHVSTEPLAPTDSLFCTQPSLVVSPNGRDVAVARQFKDQVQDSTTSVLQAFPQLEQAKARASRSTSGAVLDQAAAGRQPLSCCKSATMMYVAHM